jgi:hypothetical protein
MWHTGCSLDSGDAERVYGQLLDQVSAPRGLVRAWSGLGYASLEWLLQHRVRRETRRGFPLTQ